MNKKITVLKGDGIGPEIVDQAIKVLNVIGKKYGHSFEYTEVDIGGCSIDKHGVPITDEGMAICKSADAVLLGKGAQHFKVDSVKGTQGIVPLHAVFVNLCSAKECNHA